MNNASLDPAIAQRFKLAVERAVRPLAATFERKRALREELLAHLMSVYDEEFQRSSTSEAASDRALARFGDPHALTADLQTSVPSWNRMLSRVQWTPRPEDLKPWGLLRWIVLFTFAFNALMISLSYLLRRFEIGREQPESLLYALSVIAVVSIPIFFPFQLIAARLGEMTFEKPFPWGWKSAGLFLASSACFPLWFTLLYWGLSGELKLPWNSMWPAYVTGVVMGPLLAVVQGRRFVEDRRYLQEWASLAIDR